MKFLDIHNLANMLTLEQLGISVPEEKTYERIPFGKEMRKEFQFGPGWRNMNHGLQPSSL